MTSFDANTASLLINTTPILIKDNVVRVNIPLFLSTTINIVASSLDDANRLANKQLKKTLSSHDLNGQFCTSTNSIDYLKRDDNLYTFTALLHSNFYFTITGYTKEDAIKIAHKKLMGSEIYNKLLNTNFNILSIQSLANGNATYNK